MGVAAHIHAGGETSRPVVGVQHVGHAVVAGHDIEIAVAIDVPEADGVGRMRVAGNVGARGKGAGAVPEVEPIGLSVVTRDEVEVAVPVDIAQGDRAGVPGVDGEVVAGEGAGPVVQVHAVGLRLVARHHVGRAVPVEVRDGQCAGVENVGRQVGPVERAARIAIETVPSAVISHNHILVAVPVQVGHPDPRGGVCGAGEAARTEVSRPVVQVEVVGRPFVAQQDVEVAIAIDVAQRDGGGGSGVGGDVRSRDAPKGKAPVPALGRGHLKFLLLVIPVGRGDGGVPQVGVREVLGEGEARGGGHGREAERGAQAEERRGHGRGDRPWIELGYGAYVRQTNTILPSIPERLLVSPWAGNEPAHFPGLDLSRPKSAEMRPSYQLH